MSEASFEPCDLPDADAWITKALLLGCTLHNYNNANGEKATANADTWAWHCLRPNVSDSYLGRIHGDWPGYAARDAVMLMLKE